MAYDVNSWLLIYKSNDNYVKCYPVRYDIKKLGGFPPKPPSKLSFNKDGELTDKSQTEYNLYIFKYNKWKQHLKPWEEVFGIKFEFIVNDEPDYYYLRQKRLGLLEPLCIKYDGKHPIEDIIK